MRIARAMVEGRPVWGEVDLRGSIFKPLSGDIFAGAAASELAEMPLGSLRLLPPTEPTKIVAVGRNYADHAAELSLSVGARPRIFLKAPSALVAAGEAIVCPPQSEEVHYEAELAVIIGKRCRHAAPADALSYVFGYTCANDVTARDIQRAEGLPVYAKAFDTFCPMGPWIETELDASDVRISCTVNGVVRQDARTSEMLCAVDELIAYVSAAMTLLPGDVLLTGTPAGVGCLVPGDEVAVMIEGLGSLVNPVVAAG